GQGRDLFVEGAPSREAGWLVRHVGRVRRREDLAALRWRFGVRGVMRAGALRPVVVLGQVEQLAANLQGRQAEEGSGGGDGQLLERALQAEDGVLEDVVGLLPAMDLRITLDHFARQAAQPFAGTVE